ncbi:related to transporter (major facilitator superfamily) [Phialocephala subalpina]|uniref:Related to transporter (Major facilitator superfamily) n=1 Tax=Phialocephala subalpina TaxID=576137 RepID=A0A1L7XP33_9HELO|nr:related to transporter (major facilitator superfamily) [Phialocephala subalpina]
MRAVPISANPLKLDVRSHRKCLTICFFLTMGTFQYGLDYALVGGFLSMPGFLEVYGYYSPTLKKWNIDPTVQQLISSLMTIGTFLSSLLVGPLSAKFGRRHGLWAAAVLNTVATAIMLGTTSVGALYVARLILGVSVGWFFTFSQLYVHEAAPAHLRGVVFGFYQVMLSVGSIVGASVDFGTHTMFNKRSYQIPLAIFFVAPTIQSIMIIFFPESPRWLMVMGREQEAEKALRKLRDTAIDEHQFLAELNEIKGSTRDQLEKNKKWLWLEMWRGTNLRRTLLCLSVVCFHAANGSSWVNIYTTYFLTIAGVTNAFAMSVMITCIGLIGCLFSIAFTRYMDRRTVMMIGCSACAICQLMMAVVWTVKPGSEVAGRCVVAFISLFTFFYVAYSPTAWLVGGELPNNQLRPFTYGLATALNFVGNWLGTFTAPYFINPAKLGWSAKYGYIWFGTNALLVLFTIFFIPETRDRTLEEVHEMFENKVPTHKFKTYVCTGVETYGKEGAAKADGLTKRKSFEQGDEKTGAEFEHLETHSARSSNKQDV